MSELLVDGVSVTVVRSAQRRRTVTLERVDGRYVLRAPADLAAERLQELAGTLLTRFTRRQRRRDLNSDGQLAKRAAELNTLYFEGKLTWQSITYVTNQRTRHGSCTPARGTIRVSDTVSRLPNWVQDYVLVHELAHLVHADHSPAFWAVVNRYPLAERARGYLMALGADHDEPVG